jgi:glucose-6-phosphate 1-dehydrogenase
LLALRLKGSHDARANPRSAPVTIVIFGASGDLTQRKLVPAIHSLACEGLLPRGSHIVGVARSPLSDAEFREQLFAGVQTYARLDPTICELWPAFTQCISYLSGDYQDPATYRRLAARLAEIERDRPMRAAVLLALPPAIFPMVVEHLGAAGLAEDDRSRTRVIIEKPFGHDLETARRLNERVHAVFDEDQIYRIDHYLGKETVQNILVFPFANTIFEPLWNRNYIDHVQITVAETVGVGHRGGYYDQAGVLRDILQNHLLQLLTLIAMEPPSSLDAKALRDEKVKVLQAIRPIPLQSGVWGQYRGYLAEPSVSPHSHTPTYIALKMFIDNWRWQGVPFYVVRAKPWPARPRDQPAL